jgi:hypothetical protein
LCVIHLINIIFFRQNLSLFHTNSNGYLDRSLNLGSQWCYNRRGPTIHSNHTRQRFLLRFGILRLQNVLIITSNLLNNVGEMSTFTLLALDHKLISRRRRLLGFNVRDQTINWYIIVFVFFVCQIILSAGIFFSKLSIDINKEFNIDKPVSIIYMYVSLFQHF